MALSIRSHRPEDLEPLTALYNDFIRHTPITFDLTPYTPEQRRQSWFEHYGVTGRYRLLVAVLDGESVGYATSSPFAAKAAYQTSVEVSVYLHPRAQGQGIGTRLYQTLFDQLQTEDVHQAYAGITVPNPASIALHQKVGFRSVGVYREVGRKFDRYWDVEWWERAVKLADTAAAPSELT
ncbi:MAG: N-acetyltransferase family protein [Cyanobacteria bacterium J06632_22]